MAGRYFKVGVKERSPIFRSQDDDHPDYKVSDIYFLWFDHLSDMWYISCLPVIDCSKGSQEWGTAGVMASMNVDMSVIWCPWDSPTESNLKATHGLAYETQMRMEAKTLLFEWQKWWCNNGQNELCTGGPPGYLPPPPKAKGSEGVGLKRLQPKQPDHPPPVKAKFGPHLLPPPPAVPSTAAGSGSPSEPVNAPPKVPAVPPVPPATEKPQFSWKARCVALVGAMDLNLPQKMQYLINKLLG